MTGKDECYELCVIHGSDSSQRSRSSASREGHVQGLMSRQQSGSVACAWKPGQYNHSEVFSLSLVGPDGRHLVVVRRPCVRLEQHTVISMLSAYSMLESRD